MTADVEQGTNVNVVSEDASLMEDIDVDDCKVKDESDVPPQGETEQSLPPPQEKAKAKTFMQKLVAFYRRYDFLILLILVVLLAKAYPPLGAEYLVPKITATWIAVMYIFCKFLRLMFYTYKGSRHG